jgi:nitroreductase
VCNFDVEKITSALNIPSHIEPIAIIPIGYPAEDATIAPKVRKNIDEIVKWGSF